MKIRNGFVSNSSSSSFVVIGFTVDRDKYTLLDIAKVLNPDDFSEITPELIEEDVALKNLLYDFASGSDSFVIRDNEEDGAPSGKILIGVEIACIDDNGEIDTIEVDLETDADVSLIKNIMSQLEIETSLKVLTGNRVC